MKKKLFTLLAALTVAICSLFFCISASAEIYTGSCGADGDNVTYTLDTETGVLEISGTGEMNNYISEEAPWLSHAGPWSIRSIIILQGVTSIGSNAFAGCACTTAITLPDSLISIRDGAFRVCQDLPNIFIPKNVMSIGNDVFSRCISLSEIKVDNDNPFYCDIDGVLFSKDKTTLISYPPNGSASYVIPNGVTRIYDNAFKFCEKLINIVIPDSVIKIGYGAFWGTGYWADESNWENNVLYIGKYLIEARYDISGKYEIKEKTMIIADGAFRSCEKLTDITIPNSVTHIGEYAFGYCKNLTNINIPSSVTNVGEYAFTYCTNLISVNIPGSVTKISNSMFMYCEKLEKITIQSGVQSIGEYAFFWCTALKNIHISNSVTNIGRSAFTDTGYYNDESNWENGLVLYIGNCLIEAKSGLSGSYIIKDQTRMIADVALGNCWNLASLTIPNTVNNIGYHSLPFYDTLKTIIFKAKCTIFNDDNGCYVSTKPTVYLYRNSTADQYFPDNRVTKIYFDDEPSIPGTTITAKGDITGDSEIDIKDIVLLVQYLAGWNVEIDEKAADCNGDGKINIKDVVLLAQYLAKWDVTLI